MPAAAGFSWRSSTLLGSIRTFFRHFITPSERVSSLSLSLHKNRTRLQSTVKVCSKIIGLLVRALSTVCEQQTLRTARRIRQEPSHALFPVFEWLPSGRRPCCPGCRTPRRLFSSWTPIHPSLVLCLDLPLIPPLKWVELSHFDGCLHFLPKEQVCVLSTRIVLAWNTATRYKHEDIKNDRDVFALSQRKKGSYRCEEVSLQEWSSVTSGTAGAAAVAAAAQEGAASAARTGEKTWNTRNDMQTHYTPDNPQTHSHQWLGPALVAWQDVIIL